MSFDEEIYTNLGEVENAQKDYLRAKYLKKEVLVSVGNFALDVQDRGGPYPLSSIQTCYENANSLYSSFTL